MRRRVPKGSRPGVGGDENAAVGGHGPAAGGEAAGVGAAALGARAVGRHVHPDLCAPAPGRRAFRSEQQWRATGGTSRHTATRPAGPKARASSPFPNHERGRLGPGRFGAFDGVKGGGGGRSGPRSGDGAGLRPGRTTRHRRGDPAASCPAASRPPTVAPRPPRAGPPTVPRGAANDRDDGAAKRGALAGGGRGRRVGRGGGHRLIRPAPPDRHPCREAIRPFFKSGSPPDRSGPIAFVASPPAGVNSVIGPSNSVHAETRSTRRRARTS